MVSLCIAGSNPEMDSCVVGQSQDSNLGSRDGSISVVDLISSIRPPASTVKLPATASTAGQE